MPNSADEYRLCRVPSRHWNDNRRGEQFVARTAFIQVCQERSAIPMALQIVPLPHICPDGGRFPEIPQVLLVECAEYFVDFRHSQSDLSLFLRRRMPSSQELRQCNGLWSGASSVCPVQCVVRRVVRPATHFPATIFDRARFPKLAQRTDPADVLAIRPSDDCHAYADDRDCVGTGACYQVFAQRMVSC